MTRKAILVSAGGSPGSKGYLPGAAADVAIFKTFLLSSVGGAWENGEIVTLDNPSLASLKAQLLTCTQYDYVLVAGSGHGHHVIGKTINETRVCCNSTEEISASDLNPGSRRCTVILDCCREVTIQMSLDERRIVKAARASRGRAEGRSSDGV
jgi:hypothetical protein